MKNVLKSSSSLVPFKLEGLVLGLPLFSAFINELDEKVEGMLTNLQMAQDWVGSLIILERIT